MDTYEKKYKEAQKWVESIYPNLSHEQQMEAEAFFPELCESEDEKIRRSLIHLVHLYGGEFGMIDTNTTVEKAITWLEKQGEQASAWSEEDDKMYNSLTEFEKAVKQVMEEAIECGDTHNLKADADMLLRLTQKPWSEKDEKILKAIHNSVDVECLSKNELDYVVMVDWFNALKDRVQPKQEWSEEDEKRIKDIIYFLDTAKKHYASTVELDTCIDWLKSLRGRYTWKPSDEQMEALFVLLPTVSYGRNPAFSLYNDLKKLRGE